MSWLFKVIMGLFSEAFVRAARVDVLEAQAEAKARLLKLAARYEADGHPEVAKELRLEAAGMALGAELAAPAALPAAAGGAPPDAAGQAAPPLPAARPAGRAKKAGKSAS